MPRPRTLAGLKVEDGLETGELFQVGQEPPSHPSPRAMAGAHTRGARRTLLTPLSSGRNKGTGATLPLGRWRMLAFWQPAMRA